MWGIYPKEGGTEKAGVDIGVETGAETVELRRRRKGGKEENGKEN